MRLELVDLLNIRLMTRLGTSHRIAVVMTLIWWSNTCMIPLFYLQDESHFAIITDYVFLKKTALYLLYSVPGFCFHHEAFNYG